MTSSFVNRSILWTNYAAWCRHRSIIVYPFFLTHVLMLLTFPDTKREAANNYDIILVIYFQFRFWQHSLWSFSKNSIGLFFSCFTRDIFLIDRWEFRCFIAIVVTKMENLFHFEKNSIFFPCKINCFTSFILLRMNYSCWSVFHVTWKWTLHY